MLRQLMGRLRLPPVVHPVAAPISQAQRLTLIHHRDQPRQHCCFPGRRAGQPIHPGSLRLRLHRLGIPNRNGRTRAIRDLRHQAPPAVIASMLGYHPNTADTLAAQAGARWQGYATSRTPTQHTPADNLRWRAVDVFGDRPPW
jgi:hypothetical protein